MISKKVIITKLTGHAKNGSLSLIRAKYSLHLNNRSSFTTKAPNTAAGMTYGSLGARPSKSIHIDTMKANPYCTLKYATFHPGVCCPQMSNTRTKTRYAVRMYFILLAGVSFCTTS